MATFLDTESTTGNSITAGTLDLKLNGGDTTVQFATDTNIAPGDPVESSTISISNAGSLPGYVDIDVASLTSWENGCVGSESGNTDTSCGDPGEGLGELQGDLDVRAYFQNGPTVFDWGPASDRLDPTASYNSNHQLNAGGSDTFVLEYELPSAGDDAQSDGIEFALTFRLDQTMSGGV